MNLAYPLLSRPGKFRMQPAFEFRRSGAVVQIVDTIPFQGCVGCETGGDGREQWRFCPQLGVTSHARLGRRSSGERSRFHRWMAVPTINPQSDNVVLMTKRHRLIKWHVD